MSDLKKMVLTVKNYDLKASGELDALYSQVRCEDVKGNTFHFKEVVMLAYLRKHGAIVTDSPTTWYYKHLGTTSILRKTQSFLLLSRSRMGRLSTTLTT